MYPADAMLVGYPISSPGVLGTSTAWVSIIFFLQRMTSNKIFTPQSWIPDALRVSILKRQD
jgi:hypothetical protein